MTVARGAVLGSSCVRHVDEGNEAGSTGIGGTVEPSAADGEPQVRRMPATCTLRSFGQGQQSGGWQLTIGSRRIARALVGAVVLTLAACGSSARQSGAVLVPAGQIDLHHVVLQPPPGSKIVSDGNGAIRLEAGASGAPSAGASGGSTDTIPLAKQDPQTAMFTALNVFQSCLQGLGVKFVGAPDSSNANSPTNNPTYIKNLTTCAAKSNILQALKNEQSAQDNLTPAEIKKENQGYLAWRTCMIGRGWGIPTPTPNARGLLFSFGGTGSGSGGSGGAGGFKPPPGQSLLTSSDMQECASQAQGSTKTGG